MLAISAADAVSPAIRRTGAFLFRPFQLGTYLKLCLVAVITEGFGGNFSFSGPGGHTSRHGSSFFPSPALTSGWITVLVAVSVASIVLGFVLFYLITRLRFAYFHCLIHNTKEIGPGWRLYRAPATRFFWLNLVLGLCFLLGVGLIALPFAAGFWKLFRNMPPGGHPDVGAMLVLILPLIPIVCLLVLAALAADVILRDWMLPHYALENATAGQAWSAVWGRINAEKGGFFVYALLRIILPIVALMAVFFVMILPSLVFIAVVAAVEYGLHAALDHTVIGIVLEVLVGLVAFSIALVVGIGVGGPVSTSIREYALLFYGSRYQPLGDILYPPPPSAGLNAPGIA
jgi:hypothetical protein